MVLAKSESKLLQNQYFKNFRVLKSEKELESSLIQGARKELLERVLCQLADGRKYAVFFINKTEDLNYPEWTNFRDFNISLEIYLLDPKECKIGECFISNSVHLDINSIGLEVEFKHEGFRDNQIIWRRTK